MLLSAYRDVVLSDLHRYQGNTSFRSLIREFALNEGFRYSCVLRTNRFLRSSRAPRSVLICSLLWQRRLGHKFGISISSRSSIGPGLYIGHFGGIVVSPETTIGKDCNLSQGVTIGVTNRGDRRGTPTIGDRVYIGPGAKIFGAVHVGNDSAVGANCVVTHDVPAGSVVAGVPGRGISTQGSAGYVNNTGYLSTHPAVLPE